MQTHNKAVIEAHPEMAEVPGVYRDRRESIMSTWTTCPFFSTVFPPGNDSYCKRGRRPFNISFVKKLLSSAVSQNRHLVYNLACMHKNTSKAGDV